MRRSRFSKPDVIRKRVSRWRKSLRPNRETPPPTAETPASFADLLTAYRNDLEPAAMAICPEVGRALTLMRAQPGCLLARMSGSGPTCFALFQTEEEAARAAAAIADAKKKYWVRSTVFRGSRSIPLND